MLNLPRGDSPPSAAVRRIVAGARPCAPCALAIFVDLGAGVCASAPVNSVGSEVGYNTSVGGTLPMMPPPCQLHTGTENYSIEAISRLVVSTLRPTWRRSTKHPILPTMGATPHKSWLHMSRCEPLLTYCIWAFLL